MDPEEARRLGYKAAPGDGKRLFSASDNIIKVWDLETELAATR
jgi:hypothetical protein